MGYPKMVWTADRNGVSEQRQKIMHPPEILEDIYKEHGHNLLCMAGTLANLDVPAVEVHLLSRLPWPFLANRVAVEREKLGLSAVHPFLHWKLPPPPPDWLTPAVIVKLFDLALNCEAETDDEPSCGLELVLPA
jgi:hypothetical protein